MVEPRDLLTKSNLTDLQKELYHAVWEALKDQRGEDVTINHLSFGEFILKIRDLYICFPLSLDKVPFGFSFIHTTVCTEGYAFTYSSSCQLQVFDGEKFYTLPNAHDAGILATEDIRTIWSAYTQTGDLTPINDRILTDSITLAGFTPRDGEKDTAPKLFDGILSSQGQITGTVQQTACFFFDLEEPISLSAYAIVNGSEADSPDINRPYEWYLFATNDPDVAAAARQNSTDPVHPSAFEDGQWVQLDSSYFDTLTDQNGQKHYFAVSPKVEYRYYCWLIDNTWLPADQAHGLQIAELELYVD